MFCLLIAGIIQALGTEIGAGFVPKPEIQLPRLGIGPGFKEALSLVKANLSLIKPHAQHRAEHDKDRKCSKKQALCFQCSLLLLCPLLSVLLLKSRPAGGFFSYSVKWMWLLI